MMKRAILYICLSALVSIGNLYSQDDKNPNGDDKKPEKKVEKKADEKVLLKATYPKGYKEKVSFEFTAKGNIATGTGPGPAATVSEWKTELVQEITTEGNPPRVKRKFKEEDDDKTATYVKFDETTGNVAKLLPGNTIKIGKPWKPNPKYTASILSFFLNGEVWTITEVSNFECTLEEVAEGEAKIGITAAAKMQLNNLETSVGKYKNINFDISITGNMTFDMKAQKVTSLSLKASDAHFTVKWSGGKVEVKYDEFALNYRASPISE